jgi:hypothetical protein
MDEFDFERPVNTNEGLSTPSSTGKLTREKCQDVNFQVVALGDTGAHIVDSNAFPDGGARAWSTIGGA